MKDLFRPIRNAMRHIYHINAEKYSICKTFNKNKFRQNKQIIYTKPNKS